MMSRHDKFSAPLLKAASLSLLTLLCSASLFGQQKKFTSFDAPGAGSGPVAGTYPGGINLNGATAGYYIDSSSVQRGFVRQSNGAFTEFTPPHLADFLVWGINNLGQVLATGSEEFAPYDFVGLLRSTNGQLTAFAPAGAIYTDGLSINSSGAVAGLYEDSAQAEHGFIRNADTSFTVIDDPDANIIQGQGTVALAINDNGAITGYYNDAGTGTMRGFIRDQFGNFTNFDAVAGSTNTVPQTINLSGEVAGYYYVGNGNTIGFSRNAAGVVTILNIPGSVGARLTGINNSGVAVGFWQTSGGVQYGFQQDASGHLTKIIPQQPYYAVQPDGINAKGKITGFWEDVNGNYHGFVQ